MAAALLARRLPDASVTSAGSLEAGHPASPGSVRAMAARGLDLADHRSRRLSADLVAEADLVVGMARSHVREAVVARPDAFGRTFTLRELVRRGEAVGPVDGPLDSWLERVGAGRRPADLLGDDPDDDVADPIGRPDAEYERTAVQLADLVERLARLLDPA